MSYEEGNRIVGKPVIDRVGQKMVFYQLIERSKADSERAVIIARK